MTTQQGTGGCVVNFTRSAALLKRRATEQFHSGQRVEAVELMRMAVLRKDTPENRFALADMLKSMGCYEQASRLLYSLCIDNDPPRGTYFLLAQCQRALGNRAGATDALYFDLQQDPDSPESDDVREISSEWMAEDLPQVPRRFELLMRRAMSAYASGEEKLARRRVRRAARMTAEKAAPRLLQAAIEMNANHFERALPPLAYVLRKNPDNPRAWVLLFMAFHEVGKKRVALGILHQAKGDAMKHPPDGVVEAAARELNDLEWLKDYLEKRVRREDGNVELLHRFANICYETGDRQRAHSLWGRILRIAPEDFRAQGLYRWSLRGRPQKLPRDSLPPKETVAQIFKLMTDAFQTRQAPEKLLIPETPLEMAILWALTMPEFEVQKIAMTFLSQRKIPVSQHVLREVLLLPGVFFPIQQRALARLADKGETGPFTALVENRLAEISCTPAPERTKSRESVFLRRVLYETRSYRQSAEITAFAVRVWSRMDDDARREAIGVESYMWVKVLEYLYLSEKEMPKEQARCLEHMPCTKRRLRRILRRMQVDTDEQKGQKGTGEDEVHQF